MITTRIPGEPEQYLGRYQVSHTSIGFEAACPSCGRTCAWLSTPTGSAPACDCPTDTGTGALEGEARAAVPVTSTTPVDDPVDNRDGAGDNRPQTAASTLTEVRPAVESPSTQRFST